MPASTVVAAGALDGRAVRRLTRNSAAQRAVTTWRTQLADAWSTAASVAIGLAVLGGWLASVRHQIGTRPAGSDQPPERHPAAGVRHAPAGAGDPGRDARGRGGRHRGPARPARADQRQPGGGFLVAAPAGRPARPPAW